MKVEKAFEILLKQWKSILNSSEKTEYSNGIYIACYTSKHGMTRIDYLWKIYTKQKCYFEERMPWVISGAKWTPFCRKESTAKTIYCVTYWVYAS